MSQQGTIEAIFLAASSGAAPHPAAFAVAHPGRGLEGDRHFDDPDACDITLIEAEAIEALKRDHGVDLKPGESRRQVLVRGIDLGQLIGRRFRVGEVECEGEEHCEPCDHLAGLLQTQLVLRGLLHTGLRARIVKGGTIRPGDVVEPVPSAVEA